jgi:phage shock protein A
VCELVTRQRPSRFGVLLSLGWSALKEYRQTGMGIKTGFNIVWEYSANGNHNSANAAHVAPLRVCGCENLIRVLEESNITFTTVNQCKTRSQSFDRSRLRTALRNPDTIVCALIENNEALLAMAHQIWGEKLTRLQGLIAEREHQLQQLNAFVTPLQGEVRALMQQYRDLRRHNDALEKRLQDLQVSRPAIPQAPLNLQLCRDQEQRIRQLEQQCGRLEQEKSDLESARNILRDYIRAQQSVEESPPPRFTLLDHNDRHNNGGDPPSSAGSPSASSSAPAHV